MAFKFTGRGLAVETPYKCEVLNPATGQPLRCTVDGVEHTASLTVYSSDSARAKAYQAASLERRLSSGRRQAAKAKELEAEKVDFLAALTNGWVLISPDGDLIDEPFSEAAARALYSAPEWSFYRDAADAAIGDRANFTPKPPAS